jgi:hypothetical protein
MDATCWKVVGGLVLAIMAMAGYIVKQHLAERAILKDWIQSMRDSKSMLDLVGGVNRGRPPGGA